MKYLLVTYQWRILTRPQLAPFGCPVTGTHLPEVGPVTVGFLFPAKAFFEMVAFCVRLQDVAPVGQVV
jgi:hypothetical protein